MSNSDSFEERIRQFNSLLAKHNRIVFFSGAGVSTASGISDFRSASGLYNQKIDYLKGRSPEYMLSHTCFYQETKLFYRFYKDFFDVRSYKPNIVHIRIADLEKAGKLKGIVTQNIDGLHRAAGNELVYEVHGTEFSNHCISCGKKFDINYIFDYEGDIPLCDECRSSSTTCYVKPDVTLYEESLPETAFSGAIEAIRHSDMLIIAGTSLKVQPAAGMIREFRGESMVVVNKEPLSIEQYADVVFHEDMKDVFEQVII